MVEEELSIEAPVALHGDVELERSVAFQPVVAFVPPAAVAFAGAGQAADELSLCPRSTVVDEFWSGRVAFRA